MNNKLFILKQPAGKTVMGIKSVLSKIIAVACIFFLFTISACKEQEVVFENNDCKAQPPFIKSIGFNPGKSAFSTSEKKIKGLLLIQINANGDTSNGGRKTYQHPSWAMGGWLGPIQIDKAGNCFVAPVPVINLIDNPVAKQNIIYKVAAATGEMQKFAELPVTDSSINTNPFGIIGLAYLCETNTLYAASVQGSSRKEEKGFIYAIDAASGKIVDKVSGVDAFGMGISYSSGSRQLYFGSARSSDVFAITLSKEGKFSGKPIPAFSINNLGPRGDDKVRKIKFDKTGKLQAIAIEFNYNLTAPTEKQENIYTFMWNEQEKRWVLVE